MASPIKQSNRFVLLCCLGSISVALIAPSSWNPVACEKSDQASPDETSEPEAVKLANAENATEETATEPPLDVPEPPKKLEPVEMAGQYLKQFGYLEEKADLSLGEDAFEEAVREFQRFSNITETGKLDELTVATMSKPRCGVKDFDKQEFIDGKNEMESDSTRRKRYKLMGGKWPKKQVTWKMVSYPRNRQTRRMHKRTIDLTIDRALKSWQGVANINFLKRTGGKVDIEVGFNTGRHGSCADALEPPNEGGGGVLAHAYSPGNSPINGDVHFNDNFAFSVDRSRSASLTNVAIHELGHSLGLSHSQSNRAIMFWQSNGVVILHGDDKAGIRKLYGRRSSGWTGENAKGKDGCPRRGGNDDGDAGQDGNDGGDGDEDTEEETEETDGEEETEESKLVGESGGSPSKNCKSSRKVHVRAPKPSSCSEGQRFYAGPKCKQFWDCKSGSPKLRECYGNLVFDDKRKVCNFPHNVPGCRYPRY